MIVLLFVLMFAFMALGLEIYISMGAASMIYLLVATDTPLNLLTSTMVKEIDSYTLLAIPFFILAGELMNRSGMTLRLVEFSKFFIGKLKGGLAYSAVGVNIFSAGVSGSAPADCSAVSSVMLPAMKKDGYKEGFSASINAAAATIGPIIPPSIPMVFLALITNLSVGRLFLGGIIPGFLMGAALLVICYVLMKKQDLPVVDYKRSWKKFMSLFKDTFFALVAPVIIILGIITGMVTVTEVAILATAYVLLIGMFVYRAISWKDLVHIFASTGVFASTIMVLFSIVGIFSWIMAGEQVADQLAELFLSLHVNAVTFLILVNIFLLFIGMIMDALPAMLIFIPVLLPLALELGVDPIHFGVVVVVNLMIGLVTPPVGALLYIVSRIGKIPFHVVGRSIFPFVLALLAVLLLITFVPSLVTWIPYSMMGE
ncbi:TRAP transporter large permease [Salibacterium aidingense]|uniref:TRAP transporter large permease n=1 Tax=Salibacterium aidingense TaxID=384933 RepID=UPI000428AB68|nr:TRAP transporter large permease [Salibacterium aidingense]